jgi:hypothetical protein
LTIYLVQELVDHSIAKFLNHEKLQMIDDFIDVRDARSGAPRLEHVKCVRALLSQLEYAFCFAHILQLPGLLVADCVPLVPARPNAV